jgi:hypothetical protein
LDFQRRTGSFIQIAFQLRMWLALHFQSLYPTGMSYFFHCHLLTELEGGNYSVLIKKRGSVLSLVRRVSNLTLIKIDEKGDDCQPKRRTSAIPNWLKLNIVART